MQDTTLQLHAQENFTTPEKPLALKEHSISAEHLSSLDVLSLDKDTVTISQETKRKELLINKPLVTGMPQEFNDEVCI